MRVDLSPQPPARRPVLRRPALLVAALALGLLGGSPAAVGAGAELPLPLIRDASKPALPDFVFQVRGDDGALAERGFVEFRGKPLIATAWATWCGVCRKEMPKLDRLAQELGPNGVHVLALSIDDGGMAVIERALEERELTHLEPVHDTDKMFFVSIGAWGVPTTVIADAQGRIVARANGPVAWDDPAVRALLQELDAGRAPASRQDAGSD